jgi:hypothetical protein
MQLNKLFFEKQKTDSEFDSHALDDTSFAYSIKQMQTAIYLLLLRYALALFFMIEVLWHLYKSKGVKQDEHPSHGQI